jgi:hypothetical protein
MRHGLLFGYIETKNLNSNLDKIIDPNEKTRDALQFRRYISISDNLILTNYAEFLLFKSGNAQPVLRAHLFYSTDRSLDRSRIGGVIRLLEAFFATETEEIRNPKKLSLHLAARTRILRECLDEIREDEQYAPFVNRLFGSEGLYELLKSTLIEDLTQKEFVDAYSQTITYGMFLALLNRNLSPGKLLTLESIESYVPRSFGIMRELFDTIRVDTMPVGVAWVLEEILNVLNRTDAAEMRKHLSYKNTIHEDPYVYFYESFLGEYDPVKRKAKGVYYTPVQIVRFIIQGIDSLLRTLHSVDGLADPETTALEAHQFP